MSRIALRFLTNDERIKEIGLRYWELDNKNNFVSSVASIAKDYNIKTSDINRNNSLFLEVFSVCEFCLSCNAPYKFKDRNDFKKHNGLLSEWVCDECVKKQRLFVDSEKINILKTIQEMVFRNCFFLEDLNFKDAIFLLSLVRYSINEDFLFLLPESKNYNKFLSPNYEYTIKIYKYLKSKNIINISPLSNLDFITNDPLKNQFSYCITEVIWDVVINYEIYPTLKCFIEILEDKISDRNKWNESWFIESRILCKEVLLQELLSYLIYILSEHKLEFSPGEKTEFVLAKILDKYSVAQGYNLIWSSAKDAAAYYMRGGISKQQAANSVVGRIEAKLERYMINDWELKSFGRNYNLPTSILSQILFGLAFKSDDGGFYKKLEQLI